MRLLESLELCFLKDSENYEVDEDTPVDLTNIDISFLEQFFNHQGVDLLIQLRDTHAHNDDIYFKITLIEQKFFLLEPSDILDA